MIQEAVAQWLTLSEAARRLEIPESTLSRWAREGKVPFVRLKANGWRLFHVETIDNLKTREAVQ